MKTKYLFVLYFAFVGLLIACDDNKGGKHNITVKGADSTVYKSYEEACYAQDYEAAHKYLVAMKKAGVSDYSEAREYVFNQEALFLISQDDEASTKRLFFLLQEDNNELDEHTRDARCNTIITLAIKQDNTKLVEQTIGQYSGKIDSQMLQKLYSYLYSDGNKPDIDYMINLLKKNNGIIIMVSDAIKQQDDAMLMQILEKKGCVGSKEATDAITQYVIGTNNKKLAASYLSLLRKNSQWDAVLDYGIATTDLPTIKLAYQNIPEKDEAFKTLTKLLSTSSNNFIKQYVISLATNETRANYLIDICIKEGYSDVINRLTTKYGSQFEEKTLEHIMDYAISKSDLSLIKLSYQNIKDKDGAFNKIVTMLNSSSGNTVKQYLLQLAINEDRARTLIDVCIKNDCPDAILKLAKQYGSQFSESYLNQIMDYAISKNGTDFTNLVISILTNTPISGNPLPEGQRMTSNRPGSVVSDHNTYVNSVKEFNSKCDRVLKAAISQHKGVLAKKVVTLYKKVPNVYVVNDHWWQTAQTCTYSNEDKTRAQEELRQAQQRGDI